MKCPFCASENIRVVDSRPVEESNSIRRRRICESCGKRFTTYEKVETFPVMVIKKDQTREVYDRAKLEQGVLRACHKRPVSSAQISQAVNEVETAIYAREQAEVLSTDIGEMVMGKLRDLDMVAYVRFASVYREFKDADTFMAELKKLLADQ
ncbi:MAG: transcriptional regulator NrdR [Lachnospiraceae bacterium]|nr:transcriptional regulator NrdR [Lachnospiraceae bacterium]